MPFDDYLCKPVEREDVRAAVEQQCRILGYETLGTYFSLASKCAVIEAELPASRREDHEEYQTTKARADRFEQRARRVLENPTEMIEAFETVGREGR
jgi:hypothetical protein